MPRGSFVDLSFLDPSLLDQHLVAGVGAGVVTSLLLHPLDVVKVRFQVQDGRSVAVRYTGVVQAATAIWSAEGARGLYRGVVPACWGSGASWGLYFYFYEACKRRLAAGVSPFGVLGSGDVDGNGGGGGGTRRGLSTAENMYAAWEAGTVTCCFTNPLWLVKTRLQLQDDAPGARATRSYRGMLDAFVRIMREEGVIGLYRGFVPALLLTSHGVVQFAVYEELKLLAPAASRAAAAAAASAAALAADESTATATTAAAARAPAPAVPVTAESPAVQFAMGAVSKAVATTVTYPYQVIKSRLQQRPAAAGPLRPGGGGGAVVGGAHYAGFWDAVLTTARREGLRGFYRGFTANLARVAPQSAVTLLVYERIRGALADGHTAAA